MSLTSLAKQVWFRKILTMKINLTSDGESRSKVSQINPGGNEYGVCLISSLSCSNASLIGSFTSSSIIKNSNGYRVK